MTANKPPTGTLAGALVDLFQALSDLFASLATPLIRTADHIHNILAGKETRDLGPAEQYGAQPTPPNHDNRQTTSHYYH